MKEYQALEVIFDTFSTSTTDMTPRYLALKTIAPIHLLQQKSSSNLLMSSDSDDAVLRSKRTLYTNIPRHIPTPSYHFLFGYGSLINPISRRRTLPTPSLTIPAIVKGYHRSWSYIEDRRGYTAVGVDPVPRHLASTSEIGPQANEVNGVLIHIPDPESDFRRLDEREKNYVRRAVNVNDIVLANGKKMDRLFAHMGNVVVWMYVNSSSQAPRTHVSQEYISVLSDTTSSHANTPPRHSPCKTYPIPQTYLDCILLGCMQYGLSFTLSFIRSTSGWTGCWLNDRHFPTTMQKYVCRSDLGETISPIDRNKIDEILRQTSLLESRLEHHHLANPISASL